MQKKIVYSIAINFFTERASEVTVSSFVIFSCHLLNEVNFRSPYKQILNLKAQNALKRKKLV